MEPITNPDTSNTNVRYWERVLRSHKLGINQGRPRREKVSFVGGLNNLVGMEEEMFRNSFGRVAPESTPLDTFSQD